MSKALKIAIGAVAALVVLAVGGTWLYINVIKEDAPARRTLNEDLEARAGVTTTVAADATTTTPDGTTVPATESGAVDGDWTVTSGSEVAYRAVEVLFGQDTEGVGTTSSVTGSMTITGTTVESASFEVDMTSFKSDQGNRDNQFNGRIMDTSKFPTATFELTSPIDIGTIPADGTEIKVQATGDLTIKDQTKAVTLELTARRDGSIIGVTTDYGVVFADWNIDDPSAGPAQVEDNATLEVTLLFAKK